MTWMSRFCKVNETTPYSHGTEDRLLWRVHPFARSFVAVKRLETTMYSYDKEEIFLSGQGNVFRQHQSHRTTVYSYFKWFELVSSSKQYLFQLIERGAQHMVVINFSCPKVLSQKPYAITLCGNRDQLDIY